MSAEERLAAAETLTSVLARTTGSAEHPSGLARVTATANGDLVALDLHPAALARGPGAVGALVVETAALATDAAVQKSYDELAKSLGDGVAMAVEAFAGPPPFAVRGNPNRAREAVPTAPPVSPPGPPPPWAGQVGRAPRRGRPVEPEDDDDYFADPFRGQRQ
ncbi:YbaB/EbfC family nucleoid-associated protein [Saccharothrix sp. Mg75]|uniref:YbaB/EbfC family nucleoid-associated protein n=1 Tax=Saccharothrix sp. Mg75 TaxID=3445357 RepID=UPI003EF06ADE